MRYFRTLLALALTFAVSAGTGSAEEMKQREDLPALVKAALDNNPELKSSQARWQMFMNRVKQASALEDPMVMFKLQNMLVRQPFVFDKDSQSAKVIGISQQIPFWGKRALKQEIADYEADSAKWTVEERKLELARMVKETFYQLWAIDKELEIVEKNLKLLADFVIIAESKYSVGQGVQQDIYKAGLEKSKMLDMQINLRQQRRSLEANLNYLLNRPGTTRVGSISDFTLPNLSLTSDQLLTAAYENRPQLKSLSMLIHKGEASQRLAHKEFYPDFNLSLEYMFREKVATDMANDPGYDMFTLGVTFNLPFQQERRRAMLTESIAETSMNTEELNALKNTITFTINDTLAQLDRRSRLVELYKGGIIPQAEQSLESAVIGYRVNKVDFLTLLDGRMNLFNYERELYMSQADYMMKLAQLEAAIGTDLASTPSAKGPEAKTPELPAVTPEQRQSPTTEHPDAHLHHN